jgi:hypothetical protein
MPSRLRPVLAVLLATGLAGCAFDGFVYTVDRYTTAKPVNVRLACRDTYEVWDRPDLGAFLVITNPVNEILVCGDGGLPSLAERQRQVAAIFLAEASRRPLCRLTGDAEITERHREFTYRCPAAPPAPRGLPLKG